MPFKLPKDMFRFLKSENDRHCRQRLEKMIRFHKNLKESENPDVYKGQRFLSDLAELLECPVCTEVPVNFSFLQCKYGHIVCESCHRRLVSCPVCRMFYEKLVRPLSADKLANVRTLLGQIEGRETISHRHLVEYFRCESCLFVPTRTPVWLCNRSHLICQGCMDTRYPMCLRCKDNVYHPLSRNLFAEKILRNIIKPCRFASHGCTTLIAKLDEHEKKECLYREVACIIPGCFEMIPLCQYWDHLESGKERHLRVYCSIEWKSNKGSIILPLNFVDMDYLHVTPDKRIKMVHIQLEEKVIIYNCNCRDYL